MKQKGEERKDAVQSKPSHEFLAKTVVVDLGFARFSL